MSVDKQNQSIEKNDVQRKVDFALDVKSETAKTYKEIIVSVEKKYEGYQLAENIIKRYLKNEISKASSDNGFASISATLKSNILRYEKFFDSIKANLKNNDFTKKLGLKNANADPNTVVSTAIRDGGVTNESQKAILKFYAIMRFLNYSEPNIYLIDIYEEEIKQVPLPDLLYKFDEIYK